MVRGDLGVQGRAGSQRELLDVESVAGHLLKPGGVFVFLAEHRRALFPDEMFADLFPSGRGRPSVPVDVMARKAPWGPASAAQQSQHRWAPGLVRLGSVRLRERLGNEISRDKSSGSMRTMVGVEIVPYEGPILGEPLPLELANTTYAVRGRARDGLASTDGLGSWLAQIRARLDIQLGYAHMLSVDAADLARARELRDCIHLLATASLNGDQPSIRAVHQLNRHARHAPQWKELRWADQPYTEICSGSSPVSTAICEIAQAAVELFSGPQRARIHRCGAPGCVLYFLADHPRREWCSVACGNRVRAARHYELRRRSRTDGQHR
jgi:predicted RNA-binding Zn ribbon-like protein